MFCHIVEYPEVKRIDCNTIVDDVKKCVSRMFVLKQVETLIMKYLSYSYDIDEIKKKKPP